MTTVEKDTAINSLTALQGSYSDASYLTLFAAGIN